MLTRKLAFSNFIINAPGAGRRIWNMLRRGLGAMHHLIHALLACSCDMQLRAHEGHRCMGMTRVIRGACRHLPSPVRHPRGAESRQQRSSRGSNEHVQEVLYMHRSVPGTCQIQMDAWRWRQNPPYMFCCACFLLRMPCAKRRRHCARQGIVDVHLP